ncbi:hypothetical protein FRC0418_00636 [Corynebacterium diphtheriae]|nr:hypothetical protein FRC0418_00636 [Corynebacterium diphtheriae]
MRKIELITCGVDQFEETKAQHPHAPVVDALILRQHSPYARCTWLITQVIDGLKARWGGDDGAV